MDKKMIVMDLDGTLLNDNSEVSENTKNYLNKLKQDGYIIVLATGRILKSALIATDEAEFANYIVTDAGAAVYKKSNENNDWEKVYEDLISRKTSEDILSEYDDEKFRYINICSKNYIYMYATKYFPIKKVVKNYTDKNELLKNVEETIHISVGFFKNEFVKVDYE